MRRLSVTLNSPTQSVNAQCLSFINLFSWSFSLFHYSVMFSSLDLEMVPHLLLSSSPFLSDRPQSLALSICPHFPLHRSTAQLVGSPRQGTSPSVEVPRTRAITQSQHGQKSLAWISSPTRAQGLLFQQPRDSTWKSRSCGREVGTSNVEHNRGMAAKGWKVAVWTHASLSGWTTLLCQDQFKSSSYNWRLR